MSMNGSIHSEDGDSIGCDCRGLEEDDEERNELQRLA